MEGLTPTEKCNLSLSLSLSCRFRSEPVIPGFFNTPLRARTEHSPLGWSLCLPLHFRIPGPRIAFLFSELFSNAFFWNLVIVSSTT